MKKITSLFFAVVSTMFLAVGAARASEKLDVTSHGKTSLKTQEVFDGPSLPCIVGDDN